MFSDHARIVVRSGKGGNGHVSFRREKYVPDGGPDGGDGGRGGSVIFVVDKRTNTLSDYRHKIKFSAEDGEEGRKKNQHGKTGENLILKVPEGTIIKDAASGKVIMDMSGENSSYTILKGGRGGLGNQHFATSTMQAPKYAKPGGDSREADIILELKLIADVGLLGFPNVGKSTLLSRVTNADPKIANYHFTTLEPMLGVINYPNVPEFVLADIPGIIEGASEGIGLGIEFLRHIQRTKILIHVVDAASVEGRDPVEDIKAINNELIKYGEGLLDKPQLIAANKLDSYQGDKEELLKRIHDAFKDKDIPVFGISAVTGEGLKELLFATSNILKSLPDDITTYESEMNPNDSKLEEDPINVYKGDDGIFMIEGQSINKMLGFTNLDSERGFLFFQKYIKEKGIQNKLDELGIQDGDTVDVGGNLFEYYK